MSTPSHLSSPQSTPSTREPGPGALRLVVLGASGATGRLVIDQALARGYEVHALVRNPAGFDPDGRLGAAGVVIHRGDVHDPASVAAAITPTSVVVSALGVSSKAQVGTLTAGARAVLAADPARVVWMGAVGTGASAGAVRWPVRRLLRAGFGAEYEDKTTADGLVLAAGGIVVHCGLLTAGSAQDWTGLALARVPVRWWPTNTPRAAAAAVLLAQAETPAQTPAQTQAESAAHVPGPGGQVVVPQRSAVSQQVR